MKYCTLLVCALLVSGCSVFGKKDGTEPMELVEFEPSVELEVVWTENVGAGRDEAVIKLMPAVVGDVIYAADIRGRVEAFNRFTGEQLWLNKTEVEVTGGVGAGSELVLLGTRRGEVLALAAEDGRKLWSTQLSSEVVAVPPTNGQVVPAQTMDGKLHVLDAETGAPEWKYENPPPVLTLRGSATPLVTDSVVYAAFASGKVMAFNSDNGLAIWEHRVALPEGRSELERMVDIDAAPLLHEGTLYVGSYQGKIAALNATTGRPLWSQDSSTHKDFALAERRLFISQADGQVIAFGAVTGEIVWQNDELLRRKLNGPAVLGDYAAVGDFDGYLHILNQSDGEIVGRQRLDGAGIGGSMVSDGELLYVLSNDGRLMALKIAEE